MWKLFLCNTWITNILLNTYVCMWLNMLRVNEVLPIKCQNHSLNAMFKSVMYRMRENIVCK